MRLDGRLVVADAPAALEVGMRNGPPDVGDKAIKVHTRTGAGRRREPREAHDPRAAAARACSTRTSPTSSASKPVVLLFATPALCQSRTCGPVVDIAEQVRAENGKGVTFIQQEIYQDNDANKPVVPQVAKWRLPTEPWAFVIDRKGKVAARFEGVFSVGELARAVAKVQ